MFQETFPEPENRPETLPRDGGLDRPFGAAVAYLLPVALFLIALLAAAGCGRSEEARVVERILKSYQSAARVKPHPQSAVVRLSYSAPAAPEVSGSGRIEWDRWRYRETLSSSGWTTARGIQGGKAYYTDEDGVTRVESEPVLAELLTRSYFWRRAYLFTDREMARTGLGPSDERTVSVKLTPKGGNPLVLTFSRRGERLLAVRSPRFNLEFDSTTRFTDSSHRESPLRAQIQSVRLPEGEMGDLSAGGGPAVWAPGNPAETSFQRAGDGLVFAGQICGRAARVLLDTQADGPLRIRRDLSGHCSATFRPDFLGRDVGRGGPFAIGGFSIPALLLQRVESLPAEADAAAGAALFREAVVELDPEARLLRLHHPAKWVAPPGYFRGLLDDDGNRPVAILRVGRETLRVLAASPARAALVLAPSAAERAGLSWPGAAASDLHWGAAPLAAAAVSVEANRFDADWGEDGSLGFDFLLRFHLFFDMPHRWTYLRPLGGS